MVRRLWRDPHSSIERYYGLVDGGSNYFAVDPQRTFAQDGERIDPTGEGFYITDAFTDAATRYVGEYATKPDPFFLYVAYTAPHWPLHARPGDIEKYKDTYLIGWDALRERHRRKLIDLGLIDRAWPMAPRDAKVLRLYFGLEGGREHTLEEIGSMLGVTRERVRQLRDRALKRLREGDVGRALSSFAA